jgi:hypothetical protein
LRANSASAQAGNVLVPLRIWRCGRLEPAGEPSMIRHFASRLSAR